MFSTLMRDSSSYPVIVTCEGMVTTRATASALESADHFALMTCSTSGIVARSVQRSGSTWTTGRISRSPGMSTSALASLARGADAHALASMASRTNDRQRRPRGTTRLDVLGARCGQPRRGGFRIDHVCYRCVTESSRRASERSATRCQRASEWSLARASHRGDEHRAEHDVDDQTSGRLRLDESLRELDQVHEDLERLHREVAREQRPKWRTGRVPGHPVDEAESDEGDPLVARQHDRFVRSIQAERGEHRTRRDGEREADEERAERADDEGEARTHGAQSMGSAATGTRGPGAGASTRRPAPRLGEVVADVAEDVRELVAEEDHRDDDRDRDHRDDERVFDEALTPLVAPKALHACHLG